MEESNEYTFWKRMRSIGILTEIVGIVAAGYGAVTGDPYALIAGGTTTLGGGIGSFASDTKMRNTDYSQNLSQVVQGETIDNKVDEPKLLIDYIDLDEGLNLF